MGNPAGSITLSGVYYNIGAKYYNRYISRYSSSFYGGHFENRYPSPTGHIKWILARSNFLQKKCLLHYWLTLLHYREVLHYWLILLHYREVLHYREFITLLEQNIIIDIFQDIPLVFMTAILKIGIRIPVGTWNEQNTMTREDSYYRLWTFSVWYEEYNRNMISIHLRGVLV